jgi:D-3-phosphoglycerate dehydrogenase
VLDNFLGARFMGHDLRGLHLGLVGYGRVGERVAIRARAFGMDVSVYDPFVEVPAAARLTPVGSLEMMLGDVDIVSLHARATSDNVALMDDAAFKAMMPGSLLINTARETLIDEDALDLALESGRLGGAALDVMQPRTAGVVHPLLRHPNVMLTPHIGGATVETLLQGADMIAEEIERLAVGEPLLHVANPGVLQ